MGIEPTSKAVIGSQQVPYIFEDRISEKDFHNALLKMYNMSREEREKLGKLGKEHVDKNYNFDSFGAKWVDLMTDVYEEYGSWENRKNYNNFRVEEI